jgi:cyclase
MFPVSGRRDFLQILLGGAAGLSLSSTVFGQQSRGQVERPHTPLTPTRLSDNLILISGAGGNVLVVSGPDGLVMVNGGLPERSVELLDMVAKQSGGKRVQMLFNTDWHLEHTGSNEALGKAGTQIIAHEHTKQYLGAELFVDWQNRTYKPRPTQALPTHTFYTSEKMTFGSEPIECGHLGQAHTDGDISVFFPGSNVLMAGDVLSVGTYPIADYTTGGWLGGLVNATKTLIDLTNAETRVVPGAGPVQTRADLQAQHDMLVAMRDRLGKMMRQGMGPQDMIASGVTKEFDTKWGNPHLFVSTTYRGMWLHVRELGGVV